jgi:hydroxymethylpyrimidine/phosphomethylpyrimidine kinase
MSRPPVALTIAGSDPSGGAGIQADLKTFSALGVYGTSVITALTAQNTRGVSGVHVVPTDFVIQQLETLVADVRIDTIKIGMLANAEIVGAVADFLRRHPHDHVVLDPVMVATSGDRLLDDDALRAMRVLMPLASVITPNLAEAAALLDTRAARTVPDLRLQANALQELGAQRVLIKGGHLTDIHAADADEAGSDRASTEGAGGDEAGSDEAVDLLLDVDGEVILRAPRIDTVNTHGTGCTLSSALAALRPQRDSWLETALDAKSWLTAALAAADSLEISRHPGSHPGSYSGKHSGRNPGRSSDESHGPVHHFHEIWDR